MRTVAAVGPAASPQEGQVDREGREAAEMEVAVKVVGSREAVRSD